MQCRTKWLAIIEKGNTSGAPWTTEEVCYFSCDNFQKFHCFFKSIPYLLINNRMNC